MQTSTTDLAPAVQQPASDVHSPSSLALDGFIYAPAFLLEHAVQSSPVRLLDALVMLTGGKLFLFPSFAGRAEEIHNRLEIAIDAFRRAIGFEPAQAATRGAFLTRARKHLAGVQVGQRVIARATRVIDVIEGIYAEADAFAGDLMEACDNLVSSRNENGTARAVPLEGQPAAAANIKTPVSSVYTREMLCKPSFLLLPMQALAGALRQAPNTLHCVLITLTEGRFFFFGDDQDRVTVLMDRLEYLIRCISREEVPDVGADESREEFFGRLREIWRTREAQDGRTGYLAVVHDMVGEFYETLEGICATLSDRTYAAIDRIDAARNDVEPAA